MSNIINRNDDYYMKKVFELAQKGLGLASPNPLVGAVIMKNGKIISEGYHEKYGGHHAEVNAIEKAKSSVVGSTLYCNLEPCCHKNKQTPPCTNLLIKSGIKKVVISNLDPNPEVSGKGVEILKDSGIEVVIGVLKEQGEKINEVFFHFMRTGLPFVNLKWAQTLDGKIVSSSGHSKWISNIEARREVHLLRFRFDSVLIGGQTLNVDNPTLNIRMDIDNKGKIPKRLVLSSIDNLDLKSNIFNDEHPTKTIIITAKKATDLNKEKILIDKGIEIIEILNCKESDFIVEMLRKLGAKNISSILVEGGQKVLTSFLNTGHFQAYNVYLSQKLLGNGLPAYVDNSNNSVDKALQLNGKFRVIGDQIVLEGKRVCLQD